MHWITDPQIWLAFLTLTSLEIVLGIDNIIFIAILAGRLPPHQQQKGRTVGLLMAMVTRILLLFSITLIMRLTAPIFTILGNAISGRDIILILGGLFLLGKSTHEIHASLEGGHGHEDKGKTKRHVSFTSVIVQIMLLDVVFSIDSVITAIGLADEVAVMVAAIVVAVIVMILMAGKISAFVENHPTIKILALSFLLMVGIALVADGLDRHIPKGYIYFAMAFSVFVEMLNLRVRKMHQPVQLRRARAEKLKA
jgi:predicted tellurium resistance membrane protein TerC